jgi:hypothetical protein
MRRSACLLITLVACSFVFLCTGCAPPYKPPGAALPEGFLINCYPKSTCTRADSTPLPNHQSQQIVVLISDDDVPKIEAWYKTELTLKGYLVLSDNNVKDIIILESQNDKNHVKVDMTPINGKTIISISVYPKPL